MEKAKLAQEIKFSACLSEGIIFLNKKAELISSNQAAMEMIGSSKPQQEAFVVFLTQKSVLKKNKLEIKYLNKWLHIDISLYEKQYFLIVLRDYSHLYHLENIRRDFIGNVSHELRTPLTVIHGYLELIESEPRLVDQDKNIIPQMLQQSVFMKTLIDDLLFLSNLENVEHDQRDYRLVDAATILQEAVSACQQLNKAQHTIRVEIENDLRLLSNPKELYSLFSNLISNAIKYTPNKGEIHVRWYKQKDIALFSVSDNGIGIAQKDIARITERFYRVDKTRSREYGGTGLGLAIVKHILIHHGATLQIKSKLGSGSVFTCLFPKTLTMVDV